MSDEIIEDWHGKAGTSETPGHPAGVLSKRRSLIHQIFQMRYGGSIAVPFAEDTVLNASEATFLYHVTQWLASFNTMLDNVSATTTDMAAELTELRTQRKAVRDFLGLNERNTP